MFIFYSKRWLCIAKNDRYVNSSKKINIKTKYLYGSRESWREPFRNKDKLKIQLIDEYLDQEIDKQEIFAFVECCGTGETLDYIVKELKVINNLKICFWQFIFIS